jgi:hypothetical protein
VLRCELLPEVIRIHLDGPEPAHHTQPENPSKSSTCQRLFSHILGSASCQKHFLKL